MTYPQATDPVRTQHAKIKIFDYHEDNVRRWFFILKALCQRKKNYAKMRDLMGG